MTKGTDLTGIDLEGGITASVVSPDATTNARTRRYLAHNNSNASDCMKYACIGIGGSVLFGGMLAGSSALSGFTGSEILIAAGYDYRTKYIVNAAAAGGAVLGVPYGILASILNTCCGSDGENTNTNQLGNAILGAALAALSGIVGYAMLYQGDDNVNMNSDQFAAATAVGSAVLSGGVMALTAMCGRK